MTDVKELATLALRVLDAQRTYFKTRTQTALIQSKQLERELRDAALAALNFIIIRPAIRHDSATDETETWYAVEQDGLPMAVFETEEQAMAFASREEGTA